MHDNPFDPDAALDQLQGMQRARECYGDPPDPAFAAAVINHAAESGLVARFVQVLDDGEDVVMIWVLEVVTDRGSLELRRNPLQSWREYLGNAPEAVDLGLLPPNAPR